ncbi:MAG TPA: hypothetical protein VII05_00110, partial [Gaiellaceae bacterium]
TRFGSVPSWDWRRRSGAPEKTQAEEVSGEQEAAAAPSPKPIVEKAAAEKKKRQFEAAAWSWKSRRTPTGDMRTIKTESKPEREPEQVIHVVESIAPENVAATADASPRPVPKEAEPEEEASETDRDANAGGRLISFPSAVRGWDIWRLSELVEDTPGQDPVRQEERRKILYHLREYSSIDGRIPPEFEPLVYEAFGELMPDDSSA